MPDKQVLIVNRVAMAEKLSLVALVEPRLAKLSLLSYGKIGIWNEIRKIVLGEVLDVDVVEEVKPEGGFH